MKNGFLLRMTAFVLLAWFAMQARAQYATEFLLTDLYDKSLKEKVQINISQLLTEFNKAYAENRDLNVSEINVSFTSQMCMEQLWKYTPFRVGDTEVVSRCLSTTDGNYQVRNIPLFMKGTGDQEVYQEAVISFDANATVIDFHLAIDNNLYVKVLKRGTNVTDLRRRQIILDYVEQFRTAYNTKDMPFLHQVYSDDALIITGKVIKSVPSEINKFLPENKVIYMKQDKKTYLKKLERVFSANKRIHVSFDDIKVVRHPAKEGYYGVTLKQGYSSDNYSDIGYLFLLWDFTNEEAPQIHVRTWQPEWLDDAHTQKLPEENIFTCDDFYIM